MRVLRSGDAGEIVLEGPVLGRGGEASVYAVPGRSDLAAKVYHNPAPEHAAKLAAMLVAPPFSPPAAAAHMAVAWPVDLLLEAEGERRVVGYLMPRVEKARLLWEFSNPGARRQACPLFHYGSLLRTARNLACVVRRLHECGYVVGDLNESNVLVTPEALVTLIDVDSFQVTAVERVYRCPVGRPEYTPPELQGAAFAEVDRRPEHDAFALAVLIFQLLMQGNHPFAGAWEGDGEPEPIPARIAAGFWPYAWERPGPVRPGPHAPPWWVLPPTVQELLRLCFEDAREAPVLRPVAAQWQHALEEAEGGLTTCTHNGQHVHARGLDVCPWCVLARQQRRDPFPSAEELRARRPEAPPVAPPAAAPAVVPSGANPIREDPPMRRTPNRQGFGAGLRRLGAALERREWAAWLGAGLVGAVGGMLWALHHPPAPPVARDEAATMSQAPPPAPPQSPPEPGANIPQAPPLAPGQAPPGPAGADPAAQAEREPPKPPPPAAPAPFAPPQIIGGGGDGPAAAAIPAPRPPAAGMIQQHALERVRQAGIVYRQAVQDFRDAVIGRTQGTVTQEEVQRRAAELQTALRNLQAAQAAADAANGH
jgi:hypothetical protein